MRNKSSFAVLLLNCLVLLVSFPAVQARAQQPASTGSGSEQSGSNSNEKRYLMVSSIEVGARGIVIEGNADKYRSDLNYSPGLKLFNANLLLQSKESEGLFDKLLVDSSGWSGDPNRNLRVNAERTGWYKFDGSYRRLNYFNSLTNIALQQHRFNSQYRIGDFGLRLLPQNRKLNINLGYSLSRNSGDSSTTYNYSGDQFPLLAPLRAASNEYRVGVDAKLSIVDVSLEQGWRFFKEDTSYAVDIPQIGNNTTNLSVLNTLHRDLPVRGKTPYTRLSLHALLGKRLDLTGRYLYSGGETVLSLFETATGKDAAGNNIVQNRFSAKGKAKRPYVKGDVGATLMITDKMRISDTIRVNDFRINGAESLQELRLLSRVTPAGETQLPPIDVATDFGRTKDYRRFVNQIEVDYDFHPRFSAHIGHRYTDRRVVLSALDRTAGSSPTPAETQTFDDRANSLIFGLKGKPLRNWSVFLDLESGQADSVFTRIENFDFTNVRVRSILRPTRALAINASLVTKNNTNPPAPGDDFRNLAGVNTTSRILTSSIDWTPDGRFSLTSGYTHSRVTSDIGVLFFVANNARVTGKSRYFSRDNSGFITAFVELNPAVRLYAGYRIDKDEGQGDRVSRPDLLVGSYPLQFQSPEARVSVKLHDRADWIAGYQYFDFKERFGNQQFYHAHLPYTSLRFYFGRRE